jgi:DNA polymerase-3 subunit alpha
MLPPDINKSTLNFSTNENGIIYPLSAIKGINELTAIKILDERENGPFLDLFDFTKRMHAYKISDNQMSRLIDSGAFDSFSKSRATLRANMASANMYADICYASNGALVLIEPEKPLLREENDDPLENLDKEYEALGIMLSNNPLHFKKDLLVAKNVTPILDAFNGSDTFKVAGIVKSKKTITTKKGQTMAFIKIFDETGDLEIIVFPDLYLKHVLTLVKNNIVVIEGKIETKKDEANFIANEISLLEE